MNTRAKVAIGGAVAVVVVLGAGIFWFLSRDSPDEVSLDAAVESVSTTAPATDTGAGTDSTEPGEPGAVAGTWTVDTTTGEFDYESATGTFAGFRILEELASIGATEAVGRTGDVAGSMTIDGTDVTDAEFEIDLTSITTNEQRRDDKVQSALDTSEFPTATFTLTEPIQLGAAAASGEAVDVTATGDLTIHGETRAVEFPLQAQLVNDTVVVVGSLDVAFSDFGVEVPSSPAVVSVDDHGTLELQLLLTKS